MNDLIIIRQNNTGESLIDARELWEKLQSKQEFSHWIKDRLKDFEEGKDFIRFDKIIKGDKKGYGNKKLNEYSLTIDTAKHLCMLERNEIGHKIRQYFIDFEKSVRKYLLDDNIKNYIDKIVLQTLYRHINKIKHVPKLKSDKYFEEKREYKMPESEIKSMNDFMEWLDNRDK